MVARLRITALLIAVVLPLMGVAQNAPASPPAILVPAGTAVPVHVVGTISSATAKPDDVFQIQVADDVVVNGIVVFAKGAGGQGHIVESDWAGGNGHSGALALEYLRNCTIA